MTVRKEVNKMANWIVLEGKRYDLEKCQDLGISARENGFYGTGVALRGVFLTTGKVRRVIVESYSAWDRGDGICTGTAYHFADQNEIARLASEFPGHPELMEIVPEGE